MAEEEVFHVGYDNLPMIGDRASTAYSRLDRPRGHDVAAVPMTT